jgi:hypothetical protein
VLRHVAIPGCFNGDEHLSMVRFQTLEDAVTGKNWTVFDQAVLWIQDEDLSIIATNLLWW